MNKILSVVIVVMIGLFIFYQKDSKKFTELFISPFFEVEMHEEVAIEESNHKEKRQQYEEEKAKLLGTYSEFVEEKEKLESLKKEKENLSGFDMLDLSIKKKIELINSKINEKKEEYFKKKEEIENKISDLEERYLKVKKSVNDMQESVEKIKAGIKEGQESIDNFSEAVTPEEETEKSEVVSGE